MSLLLDLRKIRESEDRIERTLGVGDFPAESGDDYTVASAVVLRLRVLKDGDKYWLTGSLHTTLSLACCRCLESFGIPVDVPIDLRYLPQRENVGEGELEILEGDFSTAFYRDEQIDLDLMLREQFQLLSPMKPLCRQDCRGLCPACGMNLNSEQCSCDTSWPDPRLAALAMLLADRRKG
jgi:uncharacterized protein